MRTSLPLLSLVVACGGASKAPASSPASSAAPSPETSPPTSASSSAPPPASGIPMSCASNDGLCTPEPGFVKRLCNGSFPDVGLVLMSKSAPFSRMYLKGDIDGWNADGGASARARLRFDEEVLVLKRRAAPAGGVVVGNGGAGFLVMRWDGNCYTLDEAELTSKRPASPRHAPIPWRFYGERTKQVLLEDAKIMAAYQRRGKECKGAMSGDVTRTCEQADAALSAAVVAALRSGLEVPTPEKLP